MSDRLDPEVLRNDAEALLQMNADDESRIDLITSLLRQVRENDDRQQSIRAGYSYNVRQADERANAAEQERNEYREALRQVKRAVRNIRVGRW